MAFYSTQYSNLLVEERLLLRHQSKDCSLDLSVLLLKMSIFNNVSEKPVNVGQVYGHNDVKVLHSMPFDMPQVFKSAVHVRMPYCHCAIGVKPLIFQQ